MTLIEVAEKVERGEWTRDQAVEALAKESGGDHKKIRQALKTLTFVATYGSPSGISDVQRTIAKLRQRLQEAGDRRDGDACDRIEAELEALKG